MADLKTVEKRIAELRAQVGPLLREIEVLEHTARVLRSLDKGEPVAPQRLRSFSEMTMPQAAEAILMEIAPRSMHYHKITEMAIARGFRGKRTDLEAPIEKIAASFGRMMRQRPDIFEKAGEGEYRITEQHLAKCSSS
jgi:hypothetical protein